MLKRVFTITLALAINACGAKVNVQKDGVQGIPAECAGDWVQQTFIRLNPADPALVKAARNECSKFMAASSDPAHDVCRKADPEFRKTIILACGPDPVIGTTAEEHWIKAVHFVCADVVEDTHVLEEYLATEADAGELQELCGAYFADY